MDAFLGAGPAALFPGQGSQTPNMRDTVARITPDLLAYCIELVGEDPFVRVADSTRFAQPAIFCASIAGWSELEIEPSAAAGHSLGEFAALVAAGVLSIDAALQLVVLRGRLMAEADVDGSMLALLQGSPAQAQAIARDCRVVVANDNAPGQIVLSGDRERLQSAAKVARSRGLRALELGVAGAFHSPAMRSAVDPFRAALAKIDLAPPHFPVFSCCTAAPFIDIRRELADALLAPVRWRETVAALHAAGVDSFVDIGPGCVLSKLVRRIIPTDARRQTDTSLHA